MLTWPSRGLFEVVVITDPKVLDRQSQQTIAGLARIPGTIVRIDE